MTESDEELLVDLERELQRAIRSHDRRSLEGLLAEEFRTTGSSELGAVDREQWLELTTEGVEWNAFEFRSAKCVVVGDIGVVASVVNREGTVAGQHTSGEFASVDTWLRRNDRWQIVNRVVLAIEPDQ